MKTDILVLGGFETNCYILRQDAQSSNCLIIDTGLDNEPLISFLHDKNLTPQAVILTHGHADHITGVADLRQNYPDIKVYIHKLDAAMLTRPTSNLSILTGKIFKTNPADVILNENDIINSAGIELKVIHTPGHTQGGICLYCKNEGIIFVGDTLFASSVGRTDFPGGDSEQLITSIKEKLMNLPDETVCLAGHGPQTTIGKEKADNPFLQ